MKIKLIKTPRSGQKDMVFQTKSGTYSVEIGASVELQDAEVVAVMKQWPGCFSIKVEEAPVKSVEKVAEKAAEEEATKMIKEYKNKKLHTEG